MCPTITVGSFSRHEKSTFLFICSTTSNLNNFKPQQLQPQKRVQNEKKKQNRRQQPRKHSKDSTLAPLFFGTMRLFWSFLDCTKGSPLHLFRYFATQWMSKNRKGSPFYLFRHCDTVQESHLEKCFWETFSCLQKIPPSFFSIFCNQLEFHKARRVSLLNFEP